MLSELFQKPPQFITEISDDEKEECFQKLRQSTERWSTVFATNTRSVLLLESAVQDVLLRRRPYILPAHYRSKREEQIWESLLQSHIINEQQNQKLQTTADVKEANEEEKQESEQLTERECQFEENNINSQKEHVSAHSFRQFTNPYEEYEELYNKNYVANVCPINEAHISMQSDGELGKRKTDDLETRYANTLQDQNKMSSVASYHTANNVGDYALYKKLNVLVQAFREKMALQRHLTDEKWTKVEHEIPMKEVEQTHNVMERETHESANSLDEELTILRAKLEAVDAHVSDEMNTNVVSGNIWSREHHALKTVKDILSNYKQRFRKAEALYKIQQHEQQTLRIAKAQLSFKISALQETSHNMWEYVDVEWQKGANNNFSSVSTNTRSEYEEQNEQVMQKLINDLHNVLSTVYLD